jgi:predicted glycosyltransferase
MKVAKIIIDLMHPAHVNFFRHFVTFLEQHQYHIILSVLNRGKLAAIARQEFPHCKLHVIGRHRGSLFSIILEANILRFIAMLNLILREKPTIGFSVGSFILGANLRLLGKPNIQFDDDPERTINLFLEKMTSTSLHIPSHAAKDMAGVIPFNAPKEWAYLSPAYFTPNSEVLKEYNVNAKEYIFIREVSNKTLNYRHLSANNVANALINVRQEIKVIFSLEDKNNRALYPEEWILLQEPITDIHSLLYYSRIVISSGDSMAREGAMLGVPAFYCGSRIMKANKTLIEIGLLHSVSQHMLPVEVAQEMEKTLSQDSQDKSRDFLNQTWTDVNKIMINALENVTKA